MKKSNSSQIEQTPQFHNFKVALKKILAVPKKELLKREQEYQKTRKRRSPSKTINQSKGESSDWLNVFHRIARKNSRVLDELPIQFSVDVTGNVEQTETLKEGMPIRRGNERHASTA